MLDDHEIVLTFDDGPSAQTTPRIFDALAAECVKATFFLVGRNAEALPALVKREVAEGHTVAHHTFSHPARTLRQMSEKAAQEEIIKGFEADDRAAYGTASGAPKVPFFRFPGFADTPELVAFLSARNIGVFGADFWGSDWLDMTPEKELALILARIEREKRGILLLHDTKQQTAAMLPALLRELKQRGYKIVALAPGVKARLRRGPRPKAGPRRRTRLLPMCLPRRIRWPSLAASPGKGCHRCRLRTRLAPPLCQANRKQARRSTCENDGAAKMPLGT